ncbi:rCG28941, partial [Rattus norvegicus]
MKSTLKWDGHPFHFKSGCLNVYNGLVIINCVVQKFKLHNTDVTLCRL